MGTTKESCHCEERKASAPHVIARSDSDEAISALRLLRFARNDTPLCQLNYRPAVVFENGEVFRSLTYY